MKQARILQQRTSGEISLKNQSISMYTYQQIHNINYVYMFNSNRVFKWKDVFDDYSLFQGQTLLETNRNFYNGNSEKSLK